MIKKGYIKPEDRKTILLLSDDIGSFSGVATMAREIVYGTSHRYNWINIGSGINHPSHGQRYDISEKVNLETDNIDSNVIVYPYNSYGDPNLIRGFLSGGNIDGIMIFTDPRYFEWLFNMENEIRKSCPIIYYNIWDSTPTPLWNKKFYESCDALLGISKQTVNINKIVLGDLSKDKIIKYIPHGINEYNFKPIDNELLINELKKKYFKGKTPKFVSLFNSRNIRRKCIPDLLSAWKLFQDSLDPILQNDTALLLHTDPIDNNGTDLIAVREAMFGNNSNVYFTEEKLDVPNMNMLYNIANVTILPSSAEGWGLSLTESMMAGTMIIGNVTGGIQDQMRFEDDNGDWIEFNKEFLSNHFGTYKKCGDWALPVFPNNMSIVGSVQTPYINDDRLDFRDLYKVIETVYNLGSDKQKELGLKGREWVVGDESKMSAKHMCEGIIEGIDETLDNFKPSANFKLILVESIENKLTHKLVY